MKQRLQILFALLLLAAPAFAADTTPVLTAQRQRLESADFKVTGHLIRVMPDGARLSSNMTIKAHWFPGVLRVLVQLGQPGDARREMRENVLIEMRPDGENSIRVMSPGDAAPQVIPAEKWKEASIGPGFDIEDFLESQYDWPTQSIAENVKYGARTCDLVTSKPGPSDRTNYSEIRTWLDHTISFPVYAEKTLKGSAKVKEFTYLGIRHEEGVWSAHQIEAKLRGQPGSTLLIIDRGTAKAHLTAADFSAAQLAHF